MTDPLLSLGWSQRGETMSTAEVDASGSRRAAPPSKTIGLQNTIGSPRHANPNATRRLLALDDGLIDLFAEVMSSLSEASRQVVHRTSEAVQPEPSRRRLDDDQEDQIETHPSDNPGVSAKSPPEANEAPLPGSMVPSDQHAVPAVAITLTAHGGMHDSASERRATKPSRGHAIDQATQARSDEAGPSQAQQASDPQSYFNRDPGETAGSVIRDDHDVEDSRFAETDRLPSQRQQRQLQQRANLRQEGLIDAQSAKIANRFGTTTEIESAHSVAVKGEAAATIVESAQPSSTSPVTLSGVAAGLAGLSVASPTDSAATPTGIHRSEAGRSAMSGIVALRESPPSSGAVSALDKAGMNPRSEMLARVKLISRVSKAFQHLGREGGLVRLRLAPAELGTVQVEMQVRQHQVRARVVAETEAAAAALREHLPDLRARLESLGMQVERLEVETESSEKGSQSDGNDSGRWQSPGDRRGTSGGFTPRSELRHSVESDTSATTSGPQPIEPAEGNSGVDMRV